MRFVVILVCGLVAGCVYYDPSPTTPAGDQILDVAQLPRFTRADKERLLAEFTRLHPGPRDANGDGCYDKAEFADVSWLRLQMFDLDGSNSLSRAEYLTAERPIEANPNGLELQWRRQDSLLFSRSDRNGDGELTREEAGTTPRQYGHSVLTRNHSRRCLAP
jgi:hypothetical protein